MERLDSIDLKKAEKEMSRSKSGPMDLPFAMLVVLISTVGLIMMFSASYASAYINEDGNAAYFFVRQGGFMLAGFVAMYIISRVNYQFLRIFAMPLMGIAIALLILVPFIGVEKYGAKRWIMLAGISVQPSEIAKLAVIVLFSVLISTYKEKMKTFKYGILPFVSMLGVISLLLILEPHLSGTILILAVGAVLLFLGGVQWRYFITLGAVASVGAWLLFNFMPHAQKRIAIWQNPWSDIRGDGWQAVQSLYAIGSGGLFGLGLGKSRQKFLYLPEQHNDFVFAIVCEELGLIGAIIILFLFAVLIVRGYWIAIHSRDRFGSLMVAGITTLLALQTFLNVAVVTNLIPVTGISMPFFSYGGSSLLIQLAEMGIILAVSRQMPAPKPG